MSKTRIHIQNSNIDKNSQTIIDMINCINRITLVYKPILDDYKSQRYAILALRQKQNYFDKYIRPSMYLSGPLRENIIRQNKNTQQKLTKINHQIELAKSPQLMSALFFLPINGQPRVINYFDFEFVKNILVHVIERHTELLKSDSILGDQALKLYNAHFIK